MIRLLLSAIRVGERAAYWAGRAFGAAGQVRDAALVATVPLVVKGFPWETSLRAGVGVLRGKDPRPLLFVRRVAAAGFPVRLRDRETELREFFEEARRRGGVAEA